MAADPDETLEELRRARPAQEDPVARVLRDKVRAALLGGDAEPARIDRFTILERLGSGGMGAVYAAYDPKLDRRVAVKVLHASGAAARRRLLAEARALARLSHPNVVAVYDASDVDGEIFLAMEFVAGRNLRRWLEDKPAPARIVDVFVAAGRGLAAAHAAGLVHGDIKPENVLVGDHGAVKVADFGLARAEGATDDARAGTPAYMAPEQLAGAPADAPPNARRPVAVS
jgi:serine/threonine protein kinase